MTYERDDYMRRQEAEHDMIRMRDPSKGFAGIRIPHMKPGARIAFASGDKDCLADGNGERRWMVLGELEAPDGWFLHRAAHEHTDIVYRGDKHEPLPHADGPWIVEFQRYPSGGLLTGGRGHTMREAWSNAIIATKEREQEYPQ